MFLLLGWSCKGNDGPVTTLEGININPERKVREREQEIDKSWKADKPGCCDLQYNEENDKDNTATNMSLENNMSAVWSIAIKANNHSTQLKSTHL